MPSAKHMWACGQLAEICWKLKMFVNICELACYLEYNMLNSYSRLKNGFQLFLLIYLVEAFSLFDKLTLVWLVFQLQVL